MSPPRVGESGRADRNTRSTARMTDTREKEVPIVVDVDEIHTPEYKTNPVTVEEEQNPAQEVGQMEEDTERTESDTSRGQGPRQAEKVMGSVPQSHEPEVGQEVVHEGVPEVGASSPQAKWKGQAESSTHRRVTTTSRRDPGSAKDSKWGA
jgi:hypothetical protein